MWWRPRPERRSRLAAAVVLAAGAWWGAWQLLLIVDPPPDPFARKPASPQILARDGRLLRAFLSADEKWRFRAGLEEVSPHLVVAVLEHEDRWFFRHPGVNPIAVLRAACSNLKERRIVSGASTISMQLARLTDPAAIPDRRSLASKLRQTYRALQYESLHSKAEILEAYLNLVPCGGNIEGVSAAARIYFGKPVRELSIAEAALIAVLPQSPSSRHPIRHPAAARAARDRLLDTLERRRVIDHTTALNARLHPLPTRTTPAAFAAPHVTEWLLRVGGAGGGGPAEPAVIRSTIDFELQERVQSLLRNHVLALRSHGIDQGAAVVLDYTSAELVAMVGSADFHEDAFEGQVNGALAIRSPGSTLKPFVYALAFDHGLATPASMVEDVPRHLGAYQPENYDHAYRGVMSAAEALRVSRNVPAVALTAALRHATGRPLLYELLRAADVQSLDRPVEHYGLALVLGGGDMTLLELANLYADLARQGRHESVRTVMAAPAQAAGRPPAPEPPGRRLVSAASAYMVLDILTTVERPELAPVWRSGTHHVPVAWKTGTSYGHRDAWSIGIAGNYVVAVWIGNFDGRGAPELVGAEVAAPLLFDLIGAMPRTTLGDWHRWPRGLARRQVCSVSGAPPNRLCPNLIDALYRPGVSPSTTCDVHREIQVDTKTHHAVCSRCRIPGRWHAQVVAWWPSRTARLLRTHQLPIELLPPHNPACTAIAPGAAPAITSPQEGVTYALRAGVPAEDQQIALAAAIGRGSHQLYWFIDGSLLWRGPPGATVFWQPRPGRHQITVKDDAGRNATRTIHVVTD